MYRTIARSIAYCLLRGLIQGYSLGKAVSGVTTVPVFSVDSSYDTCTELQHVLNVARSFR